MAEAGNRPAAFYPGQAFEDLAFRASRGVSVGVELELQLLDRDTGELAPGAQRILDVCADEGIDGVSGEFLLSMLEIKTGVCGNIAEVRDSIVPLLRRVSQVARTLGYDVIAAGTHPSARPSANAVAPGERYEQIRRRQAWFAYQENVYAMHVHVGVPGGDEAVALMSLLVPYLPHMLALSASSPFWQGTDTGYASIRALMFRPTGNAGVPPHFSSWEQFGCYCRCLHQAGFIESTKDLYWDIRPRPGLGTIEFRIFDATTSMATLLGLTALVRSLVLDGLRLLKERPQLLRGDPMNHWIASENKWLAARYGLDAECVRRPGRERRSLAEDTSALLVRLMPVAQRAGDDSFLAALLPDRHERAAERRRWLLRQGGSWQTITNDLRDRLAEEVADRTAGHFPCPPTQPKGYTFPVSRNQSTAKAAPTNGAAT